VLLGDIPHANADFEQAGKLDAQLVAAFPRKAELAVELAKPTPPREDVARLQAALKEQALGNADWAALIQSATDLVKTTNCYRVRADETYQNRLRDLSAATKTTPTTADSLADLGEFLYHEATHVRGESVEPRAEYESYRPSTKDSIAAEMARAEQSFDAALALNAEHVKALTYKAGCLMWRLKWGDAETVLKKALGHAPDSPQLLELFSQLLDHAAGVKAAKAADLRSVDTWSDMSYIYWRSPSQSELDQADEYERQAEELWKLGAQYLDAAAKAATGTARGFYYEGVIARRNRDIQTARTAFEKAVENAPDMIEARDQLAAIYSASGMVDKAHEQQSAANNVVQTTAGPMLRLAWLETARTARKAAREAANQAAALDPADPRCPAYLGVTQHDAEKYAEAIAYFRMALALLETRARFHGQTMEPAGTGPIHDSDLGLALGICSRLADSYSAAGQDENSLETYRRIAALAPRISAAQLHGELVLGMLPDPAADQTNLPEARPAGFHLAWAHVKLGDAARSANRLEEANAAYQAVQKMVGEWPMTAEGRHHLNAPASYARVGQVRVLAAQGRTDEAFRLLTREGFPQVSDTFRKDVRQLQEELARRRSGH
jgi:tetratricopeptide (TPR) repeat protein